RDRRPVAKSNDSIEVPLAKFLQCATSSVFRRVKSNRERIITPRIRKLVAAVGNEHQAYAELARRGVKASRLVAKLRGKEQNGLVRVSSHASHGALGGIRRTLPLPENLLRILVWEPTGPRWVPLNSTKAR